MSDPVKDYVNSLDVEQRIAIINDWESYEKLGTTPNYSFLRVHARNIMETVGASTMITTWMELLAFECYRNLMYHYKTMVFNFKPTE